MSGSTPWKQERFSVNEHCEIIFQRLNLNVLSIEQFPFMVQDISSFLEDEDKQELIQIINVKTAKEYRKQGKLKETMKAFAEQFKDKVVVLAAGLTADEYPDYEKMSRGEVSEALINLIHVYIRVGFTNINDFVCYEESTAFILNNEKGKAIRNKITLWLALSAIYDLPSDIVKTNFIDYTNKIEDVRATRDFELIQVDVINKKEEE